MDAGNVDSLRRATYFVCMIEEYQGMSISAPEEIAYLYEWTSKEKLAASAEKYGNSPYGARLKTVDEAKRLKTVDMDRYWIFCYEVLTVGLLDGEWKITYNMFRTLEK